VGGEATLTSATAKLARDKLKSAEAREEEARNETRGEVSVEGDIGRYSEI